MMTKNRRVSAQAYDDTERQSPVAIGASTAVALMIALSPTRAAACGFS